MTALTAQGPGAVARPRRRWLRWLALGVLVLAALFFLLDIEWIYDADPPGIAVSDRARNIHQRAIVIDLHADCMLWDRDLSKRNAHGHVDIPRWIDGGVDAQAIFLPSGGLVSINALHRGWGFAAVTSRWAQLVHQTDGVRTQLGRSEKARYVTTAAEVRANHERGVISLVHGIEGAHALDGDLTRLDEAASRGVLFVGPVHFFDNEYGGHGGGDGRGLSERGRRLIERMNRLGLILDTAHASSATIKEAVALTRFPPINSHSGVKGVKDHWRNLSDADIDVIAAKGGVIGVMFGGWALDDPDPKQVIAHMRYIIERVGDDHVALGSDWDGFVKPAVDAEHLPALTQLMLDEGWSEERIRKILGENVLRVWAARDAAMVR